MPNPTVARCPTCKRRHKRTLPQNARLWLLYHAIAEKVRPGGQTFSAEVWHTWAKSKFLGCDDVKLPSGKVLSIPRSTSDLDVPEFNDYMTRLEVWANDHGVWLEDEGMAA